MKEYNFIQNGKINKNVKNNRINNKRKCRSNNYNLTTHVTFLNI